MRPYQVLPLQVRMDLEVIAMKVYTTFPKAWVTQLAGVVEYTDCISAEG